MQKGLKFVGMRGFVMTTDQITLENMNIQGKEHKNQQFRKVFEHLKNDKKLYVEYKKRPYYLYYVNEIRSDIVQCKLCRKTTLKRHDLGDIDVNEELLDDYPYINIFVHLQSQKFLVEINKNVFGEDNTPRLILQEAISRFMYHSDCYINLETITDDKVFWNYIDKSHMIYEVELVLKAPNLFGVNDTADDFVKAVEQATNAKSVGLKLSNIEGKLDINKDNIDKYIEFANAGGGSWSVTRSTKEGGKKTTIKSAERAKVVNINITRQDIKIGDININNIVSSFNEIEHFEEFKMGDAE